MHNDGQTSRPPTRPDVKDQVGRSETPAGKPDPLNIPNLITLGRILLVPIVVWAISTPGAMWIAFLLFVAAGISDAVDGFLANASA